jgi:hypothetical protein
MRASDEKSGGLITAGLLAVVVSLVGLAGAVRIAQTAVAFGPNVGDIVQFDPRTYMPVDAQTEIVATRPDAGTCTLDVATIHANGGSIIVEQRYRAGDNSHYLVHWAGKRTAAGAGDCGEQANLKLDDANLDMLAMAAGGWGVHLKHANSQEVWTGDRFGRVAVR